MGEWPIIAVAMVHDGAASIAEHSMGGRRH